jgi:hypothetical protein
MFSLDFVRWSGEAPWLLERSLVKGETEARLRILGRDSWSVSCRLTAGAPHPPGKKPLLLFVFAISCILSPLRSRSAFAPATIKVEFGGGVMSS